MRWISLGHEREATQAAARRFALVLGRSLQLALLIEQAQWSWEKERDEAGIALARRFSSVPLQAIDAAPLAESRAALQGPDAGSEDPEQVKVAGMVVLEVAEHAALATAEQSGTGEQRIHFERGQHALRLAEAPPLGEAGRCFSPARFCKARFGLRIRYLQKVPDTLTLLREGKVV